MNELRRNLYKLPWSRTDNQGGWIEVTDDCDLFCPDCYRRRLEGHRSLEELKKEIIKVQELTNCDCICIAGGEPLIYPYFVDVVKFISKRKMKSVLFTNGEKLTGNYAAELKKAGLSKIHFHIDSAQNRPGWEGKNESEMNELRQHYADLLWDVGGIQCGYNVTVFRSNIKNIPEIVEWCRANIHKVQHITFIAFRGLPLVEGMDYMANGKKIDINKVPIGYSDTEEINISTDEMFDVVKNRCSDFRPCAYINGTSAPQTNKHLVVLNAGSKRGIHGFLGRRTVELVQEFYHLFKGRYCSFFLNPVVGKKLFILSFFDKEVKKTFGNYLKASMKNPLRIFEKIYIQCINFQQPNEMINGEKNLCDSCVNPMVYQDKLINPCQLDEYRIFGGLITAVPSQSKEAE
jgi:organic radical activating enzyme